MLGYNLNPRPLSVLIAFLDALTKTGQKAAEGRMGLFWLQLAGTQSTMAGTWNWSHYFYRQEAEKKQAVKWTQRTLEAIPPGDFAYWRLHNLSSHKLGTKCSHSWAYGGGHFTSNHRTQNINLLGSSVFIEVINLKWGSLGEPQFCTTAVLTQGGNLDRDRIIQGIHYIEVRQN